MIIRSVFILFYFIIRNTLKERKKSEKDFGYENG